MERVIIEYDRCGLGLDQHLLDQVWARAIEASQNGKMVDIVFRRVGTTAGFPRLVVDDGRLYAVLIAAAEQGLNP